MTNVLYFILLYSITIILLPIFLLFMIIGIIQLDFSDVDNNIFSWYIENIFEPIENFLNVNLYNDK